MSGLPIDLFYHISTASRYNAWQFYRIESIILEEDGNYYFSGKMFKVNEDRIEGAKKRDKYTTMSSYNKDQYPLNGLNSDGRRWFEFVED